VLLIRCREIFLQLIFVQTDELSQSQRSRINELQKECFSHVSREDVEECFIAPNFGWIFAYENGAIIGQLELFNRKALFDGQEVILGGMGGTCVTASARHRGIAREMVRKGLEILKQEKRSDVACLNANLKNFPLGGLYYEIGFRLMERSVSFEDLHGHIRFDSGEVFIAVCSEEIYNFIMNSDKTFHIGRGYW
jgi:ribosomal protein S18 acetylase RimI-like enzyme